jgi:hypothetical protein
MCQWLIKAFSLILSLAGLAFSVLMGIYSYDTLFGVTKGIALFTLQFLLLLAEIKPSILVYNYCRILLVPYGRSAFLVGIGLLYASRQLYYIFPWIYFWILAVIYFIVGLCGEPFASSVMNGCCGKLPNSAPIVPTGDTYPYVGGTPPQAPPRVASRPYGEPAYVQPPVYAPQYVRSPYYVSEVTPIINNSTNFQYG